MWVWWGVDTGRTYVHGVFVWKLDRWNKKKNVRFYCILFLTYSSSPLTLYFFHCSYTNKQRWTFLWKWWRWPHPRRYWGCRRQQCAHLGPYSHRGPRKSMLAPILMNSAGVPAADSQRRRTKLWLRQHCEEEHYNSGKLGHSQPACRHFLSEFI